MNKEKRALYDEIDRKLSSYDLHPLPGITTPESKDCLLKQIVDSVRRIKYVQVVNTMNLDESCANPNNIVFNPLKAAVWYNRNGNLDEAFWLTFLAIHFGKHALDGWNYVRNVYGKFGEHNPWNWNHVSQNINGFRLWLNNNQVRLKDNGTFSNHRRYQSLDAYSDNGTGSTIESYINWIGDDRSHLDFINRTIQKAGDNPRDLFKELYKSMSNVVGFARLGKFDFLTMIGKLGLVNIEPDSTYISGATGPRKGAQRLFGINVAPKTYDNMLAQLENHLGLYYGMQILEDAICNWQKSPEEYIYFRG